MRKRDREDRIAGYLGRAERSAHRQRSANGGGGARVCIIACDNRTEGVAWGFEKKKSLRREQEGKVGGHLEEASCQKFSGDAEGGAGRRGGGDPGEGNHHGQASDKRQSDPFLQAGSRREPREKTATEGGGRFPGIFGGREKHGKDKDFALLVGGKT